MLSGCLLSNTSSNDSISIQKQSPSDAGRRRSRRCRRPIRATQLAHIDNARFYALTTLTASVRADYSAYFSLKRARTSENVRRETSTLPFLEDVRPDRTLSVECPCFAHSAADLHAEPRGALISWKLH